MINEVDGLIL